MKPTRNDWLFILTVAFTFAFVIATIVTVKSRHTRKYTPAATATYELPQHRFISPITCSMNGKEWTVSAEAATANGIFCRIEDMPK